MEIGIWIVRQQFVLPYSVDCNIRDNGSHINWLCITVSSNLLSIPIILLVIISNFIIVIFIIRFFNSTEQLNRYVTLSPGPLVLDY